MYEVKVEIVDSEIPHAHFTAFEHLLWTLIRCPQLIIINRYTYLANDEIYWGGIKDVGELDGLRVKNTEVRNRWALRG